MPVQGLTRFRRHQFGRQSTFGTAIAAKRAYAFKGVPAYGEPWIDPEVDTGSIDPVAAPYRGPGDYTAALTDPALRYNNLPLMLSAFFGGGVIASGGPTYTRLYDPSSTTVDPVDVMTYEYGDDVVSDWMQMRDGVLESMEFTAPEGKGAMTASMTWRFGALFSSGFSDFPDDPPVPTDLAVDPNEVIVYGKDTALYIASDPYDLTYSGSRIADALHTMTLRLTKQLDQKRWINGTQSFDIDAYAVTGRTIELECSFAKTPDIVGTGSETDAWFSDQAVDRYIRLYSESTIDAGIGVPYSFDQSFPMRYRTRVEGESGGNSLVVLTGRAFFAPTHNIGAYSAELVNTLADADF